MKEVVIDRDKLPLYLEALDDVMSDIENGSETDPRVYVCTWQERRLQDALVELRKLLREGQSP